MSGDFAFKQATRTAVKPLVGLFGKSGGGKTMSALLLARGIAGPSGRIGLIDSESGRGNLFADLIPGGYEIMPLEPPFSTERYMKAVDTAEASGIDVLVVDSLSHQWTSEGGVLDQQEAELTRMAGDNWQKREACKMAAWIKPKMEHKRFVQRLLRVKMPLICCLRGEEKTHIEKEEGKNKVVTDKFSSPIYDPRFLFELLICAEIFSNERGEGGFIHPTKVSHPAMWDCLPKEGQQIGIKHGELIRQWAESGGKMTPQADPHATDDMLTAIHDATSTFELTQLAEDSGKIEDATRRKHVKTAIMQKAKALGFTYDEKSKCFADS